MSKKNGESKKTFKIVKRSHKKSQRNKITPHGSSSGTIAKRSLKSRCAKIKAHAIAAKANMKRIKARNQRRVATSKPHQSRGRRHRRRKKQNKKCTRGEQAPRSTAVPGATARSYVEGSDYSMSFTYASHFQVITRENFMDNSQQNQTDDHHDARTYNFDQSYSQNFGVQDNNNHEALSDDDDPMQDAS